ncbi:hypothetical protein R1sor_011818 [Riccia sorocarpa]|uniref:DUF427 domain-containing protein n=1 Tax=Riccia sorocarpa TaxID=122646 RepID=A0ABD3I1Z3_9MARC
MGAPTLEPVKENVRIIFNDAVIADTTNAYRVAQSGSSAYYIPPADLKLEHLTRVSGSSHCPWKGDASYWTLSVGDKKAESVAWSYEDPKEAFLPIKGYLAFYTNRVDAFYVGEGKV